MKYLKRKKTKPLWLIILADLAMVGIILVVFALFHHVLPRMVGQSGFGKPQMSEPAAPVVQQEPEKTEPEPEAITEPEPQPEMSDEPSDETLPEEPEEPVVEEEPDLRTEWQKKFEDHFTEEVMLTENSYSSPEVSVTIETVDTDVGGNPVRYYLAEVYIASIENFTARTAYGEVVYFGIQDPVQMAIDTNAIFAVNGDYMTVQKEGFLVRNGTVYASDKSNSICVLYPDGVMETYDAGTYVIEDILAREPLQVWSFGPALLDENGQVKEEYDMMYGVAGIHPRCAVGYFEPGHYCFVAVDGRQNHSIGMRLTELAQIFADLGCKAAYNMDGGASAVMMFDQRIYNEQSNDRDLSDILLICDSYYPMPAEEEVAE